jgi:hypothetical protein
VLPVDAIDLALDADVPLPSPAPRTGHGADLHESIGARVAGLVPDAATLRLGIGGVPDAVLADNTGADGTGTAGPSVTYAAANVPGGRRICRSRDGP